MLRNTDIFETKTYYTPDKYLCELSNVALVMELIAQFDWFIIILEKSGKI